jgi:hypothetical protein
MTYYKSILSIYFFINYAACITILSNFKFNDYCIPIVYLMADYLVRWSNLLLKY